jgi:hypothetical protein
MTKTQIPVKLTNSPILIESVPVAPSPDNAHGLAKFHLRFSKRVGGSKFVITHCFSLPAAPVDDALMEKMVTQTRAAAKNKDPSIKFMLNETRVLLDDFFRPFNQVLVDLLGDKKYLFEDKSNGS